MLAPSSNYKSVQEKAGDISYESLNMSESNPHLPVQFKQEYSNKLKALNKLPKPNPQLALSEIKLNDA